MKKAVIAVTLGNWSVQSDKPEKVNLVSSGRDGGGQGVARERASSKQMFL